MKFAYGLCYYHTTTNLNCHDSDSWTKLMTSQIGMKVRSIKLDSLACNLFCFRLTAWVKIISQKLTWLIVSPQMCLPFNGPADHSDLLAWLNTANMQLNRTPTLPYGQGTSTCICCMDSLLHKLTLVEWLRTSFFSSYFCFLNPAVCFAEPLEHIHNRERLQFHCVKRTERGEGPCWMVDCQRPRPSASFRRRISPSLG